MRGRFLRGKFLNLHYLFGLKYGIIYGVAEGMRNLLGGLSFRGVPWAGDYET